MQSKVALNVTYYLTPTLGYAKLLPILIRQRLSHVNQFQRGEFTALDVWRSGSGQRKEKTTTTNATNRTGKLVHTLRRDILITAKTATGFNSGTFDGLAQFA